MKLKVNIRDFLSCNERNNNWDLKFSNILKNVENLNKKIEEKKKEIDNSIDFKENIKKPISKLIRGLDNKDKNIWDFDLELFPNYIKIKVDIKNSLNNTSESICFYSRDFEGIRTQEDIVDFVKSKLLEKMRKIYNYVLTQDGIDSEYRHMFMGGTKFDTNK